MATDISTEVLHRERAAERNARYINYSLLKNVSFQGEPVVPKIIEEGEDEFGKYFNVEKLPGLDLGDILKLSENEAGAAVKMKVLKTIIGQFEAIDKAGFVIFDRNGGNIRVLDWKEKVSIRQMDLEDVYDKQADAIYSVSNPSSYEYMLDQDKKIGADLWMYAARSMIIAAKGLAVSTHNIEMENLLIPYVSYKSLRKDPFQKVTNAFNQIDKILR